MNTRHTKTVLPICTPSVTVFLHHAHSLAIAECDPRARTYLINSFINLYSGMGSERCIDFYSADGMYPRYPFVHIAWLHTKTIKAMSNDLVEAACGILDSGCYVEALLDEFFLSEKPAFERMHLPHQSLIYGYCREERCFFVQGFNRDFVYGHYRIFFDEFVQGLRDDLGFSVISRTDLLEYSNSHAYDASLIRTQLSDFIRGECSFATFRPADSRFGMDTYDVAIELVQANNGGAIDVRPWCVFHEHKKKLQALCGYLQSERGIDLPASLLNEFDLLENDFMCLRNYLLEAKVDSRDVSLDALSDNLQRIRSAEKPAVEELITCVR